MGRKISGVAYGCPPLNIGLLNMPVGFKPPEVVVEIVIFLLRLFRLPFGLALVMGGSFSHVG
jgi:hypothetical protein